MKSIGDQVREFRELKGWELKKLADAIGTSRQNVESLERTGNRLPKYLWTLARVMGTTADAMLSKAGLGGQTTHELFTEETEGAYSVPLLSTAGSMGPGADVHDEVVVGRLTLSPAWISRRISPLSKPQNLKFIHGYGDSMEPTFVDGDILLVDSGINDARIDGVYVLEANERIYIKRVRQRLDGIYEISSDNATVKTVDVLDGSNPVAVRGRVVWVWNGKKL